MKKLDFYYVLLIFIVKCMGCSLKDKKGITITVI